MRPVYDKPVSRPLSCRHTPRTCSSTVFDCRRNSENWVNFRVADHTPGIHIGVSTMANVNLTLEVCPHASGTHKTIPSHTPLRIATAHKRRQNPYFSQQRYFHPRFLHQDQAFNLHKVASGAVQVVFKTMLRWTALSRPVNSRAGKDFRPVWRLSARSLRCPQLPE